MFDKTHVCLFQTVETHRENERTKYQESTKALALMEEALMVRAFEGITNAQYLDISYYHVPTKQSFAVCLRRLKLTARCLYERNSVQTEKRFFLMKTLRNRLDDNPTGQ